MLIFPQRSISRLILEEGITGVSRFFLEGIGGAGGGDLRVVGCGKGKGRGVGKKELGKERA